MILFGEYPYEIILSYKRRGSIEIRYWIKSLLIANNPKMFYLGLTFLGLSVTIQKKKPKVKNEEDRNHRNQTEERPN